MKVFHHFGIVPPGLVVFAVAMPPIVALSWLSWHLIEKRALALENIGIFGRAPRGQHV